MALVGEGRGFKVLIGFAVMTVLLTIPMTCIKLSSLGLWLAQDEDGNLAAIACRPDFSAGLLNLRTQLSAELPATYPLVAQVRVTAADGSELSTFTHHHVDHRSGGHAAIAIQGPIRKSTPTTWTNSTISIELLREDTHLITIAGTYQPPKIALTNVTVTRPTAPEHRE